MGMGSDSRRRLPRAARPAALVALCSALLAPAAAQAEAPGFLYELGETGSAPAQFRFPVSVTAFQDSDLFVADSENNRVQRFGKGGEGFLDDFVTEWGSTGSALGQFSTPEGVAASSAGNVYVLDKGNARVQEFNSSGGLLCNWGMPGAGPGQFDAPEGIAVGPTGEVYVADTGNNRIQRFGPGGEFLGAWGSGGSGTGQFDQPDAVAVDAAGNVYVADTGNDRVQKFDSVGTFLDEWGTSGDGPGEFDLPVAVAVAGVGDIYVADAANDRVEAFTTDGKFLFELGETGDDPGLFQSPLGLTVDSNGRLFVADSGNDRVQAFGDLPDPQYGDSFDAGPVSGVIKVKVPGSDGFVVLGSPRELPIGTIVDTDNGRMRLTSAKSPKGGVQSAEFFEGTFKVLQTTHGKPITVLKLRNKVHCGKKKKKGNGKGPVAGASKKKKGLWGSGKGNYRSEGQHGSATVEGTIWWAQDRCDGTLFKVKKGVVTVRDFTNHKTVKIHAGQHYLAPAG